MERTETTSSPKAKKWERGEESKIAAGRRKPPSRKKVGSESFPKKEQRAERGVPLADRLDAGSLEALRKFRKSLEK